MQSVPNAAQNKMNRTKQHKANTTASTMAKTRTQKQQQQQKAHTKENT